MVPNGETTNEQVDEKNELVEETEIVSAVSAVGAPSKPRTGSPTTGVKKFQAAAPHPIAGLYFLYAIDPVIECASRVAQDFLERPHLYTAVGVGSAQGSNAPVNRLAALRARYGHHESLPDQSQRDQIYRGVFGVHGSTDADFSRLKEALVAACTAFAERVFDTGVDMLRERVVATHRPFQEYIVGLEGESLSWSRATVRDFAEDFAFLVLRDPGVAAVFGVVTPPRPEWPYQEDSNGDKLIEQIHRQVRAHPIGGLGNVAGGSIHNLSREAVSSLQRAGLRGAAALQAVVDYDEGQPVNVQNDLIRLCYTWGSALQWVSLPAADGVDRPRVVPSPGAESGAETPFAPPLRAHR
jgi:hypothetical protein